MASTILCQTTRNRTILQLQRQWCRAAQLHVLAPSESSEQVTKTAMSLPSSARCVVVGGGIAGTSVAYHLAKAGWKDTVLLERDRLTSGTTWHAAGLVGRVAGSPRVCKIRKYGVDLYNELEETTGMSSGYAQNGGITIATDKFRQDLNREWISRASAAGVELYEIGPEETKEKCPIINTDDVLSSIWSPNDGQINPVDGTMMLAEAARLEGATILEQTPITKILTNDQGAVCGVETHRGVIECEYVCLAGGMWTRQLAETIGVSVPLWPCEHEYVLTAPIEGARGMPIVRTYDESLYLKDDAGRVLIGLFEPNAKFAWGEEKTVPNDFSFGCFPDDHEHLAPYLEKAMHRLPALEHTPITTYFAGPESFTPDGSEALGEVPEVKRLFVCAGFNSHGISFGPAAGRYIADWMIKGSNGVLGRRQETFSMDINRFQPWQSKLDFIRPVAAETLGKMYNRTYQYEQRGHGRNQILSPIHSSLEDAGAVFGAAGGYERPLWFENNYSNGADVDFAKRYNVKAETVGWEHVKRECIAAREKTSVFDLSSFSKFTIEGDDAVAELQRICSADINKAVGRVAYTLMLNDEGGIETACVVSKLGENNFMITAGSGERTKIISWIKNALTPNASVKFEDVTEAQAIIAVSGPTSRELLQLCTPDFDLGSIKFSHAAWVDVSGHRVWMQRLSYAGESGYELYVDAKAASDVHNAITMTAAKHDDNTDDDEKKLGLVHAGSVAQDILRLEKGFVHWGHDATQATSPLEAGLGFAVSLKKPFDFMGKEVHARELVEGVACKRAMFKVIGITGPANPLIPIGSPIFDSGTKTVVGETTSSGYSFCYDTGMIMAHVENLEGKTSSGCDIEVEVGNVRFSLEYLEKGALHDPSGVRMRV
eukprot:m.23780 g.23780  ORF g.23780 m.23780 type:complete len:885 (+) comp14353_c0_seq1:31-2685(+)